MQAAPVVRDICLVGGGHSHALLLHRWAMQPLAGIRLTLVSSAVQTPYSGMLPGLIAGHYSYDDVHIDLLRLCNWANVRFIEDTVVAVDLEQRQVRFSQRPALAFDALSLDTGSTPDLSVPGSAQYVTPVKPVSNFYTRWQRIEQRLKESSDVSVSIGIVGSGAGGFELVTAMRHRLKQTSARCYWFLRGDTAISGRPARVGQLAMDAARAAGIEVVQQYDVVKVEQGRLVAADGRIVELDEIVWCTAATGPDWPRSAGLDTDKRGFVATNAYLQSNSHPFVFATGDIGTQVQNPSDKAGVFAVRQAPYLFENLRRFLQNQKLKAYTPQKDFLSLMATGGRHGIASRGPVVVHGDWVWRWKNHIDQSFMDKFRYLPRRHMNASLSLLPNALAVHEPTVQTGMRCRGCGAKVGNNLLQRVLNELLPVSGSNRVAAWSPAGDAAVVDLPGKRLVQSVDQINAIVDDPWLLGRIAALHAISDVVTLNANVQSAQVILTLPEASDRIVERDLRLMMQGILTALDEEQCELIGGHTAQGADMCVGLVVNAIMPASDTADTDNKPASSDIQAGDVLILSKALGVGTLFAALMKSRAYGPDVASAMHSMLLSNRPAATILRQQGSRAMTDITGFGLLGHLQNLLYGLNGAHKTPNSEPSVLGVKLLLDQIPLMTGALELSQQGCRSSLYTQNSQVFNATTVDAQCDPAAVDLLVDPQTSGGLLALVPAASAFACVQALIEAGYAAASVIGTVTDSGAISVCASELT